MNGLIVIVTIIAIIIIIRRFVKLAIIFVFVLLVFVFSGEITVLGPTLCGSYELWFIVVFIVVFIRDVGFSSGSSQYFIG